MDESRTREKNTHTESDITNAPEADKNNKLGNTPPDERQSQHRGHPETLAPTDPGAAKGSAQGASTSTHTLSAVTSGSLTSSQTHGLATNGGPTNGGVTNGGPPNGPNNAPMGGGAGSPPDLQGGTGMSHGPAAPFVNTTGTVGGAGAGLGWQLLPVSPHVQSAAAPAFLDAPNGGGVPYLSPVIGPSDWASHQYLPMSNLQSGFFTPTGQAMNPISFGENAAIWGDLTSVVPGTPSMAAVPSRSPFHSADGEPVICNGPVPYGPDRGGGGSMRDVGVAGSQQHYHLTNSLSPEYVVAGHSNQLEMVRKVDESFSDKVAVESGDSKVASNYGGVESFRDMNMLYLMNQASNPRDVQQTDGSGDLAVPLSPNVDWPSAFGTGTPAQMAFADGKSCISGGPAGVPGFQSSDGQAGGGYVSPAPAGAGGVPSAGYTTQERVDAFHSLEDERVWIDWENGKLDGRLIDTVLHAKSLIEQMLNDFSVERASEVLRAASTLLGRTQQVELPTLSSGGALPSVKLVHPDEFKNPSTFLQIYGDPLCFTKNGTLPKKGRNGNWECFKCSNVNFPRRFRCNMCSTTRDEEGDWVVCEYARQVYERYLSIYKNQQRPGQRASSPDAQIGGGQMRPVAAGENCSTISGHTDILIPTSGAIGPGGGLFNFPMIGPPAQRPSVGGPQQQLQQQQQQQSQHSFRQSRTPAVANNNDGISRYNQHQQQQRMPNLNGLCTSAPSYNNNIGGSLNGGRHGGGGQNRRYQADGGQQQQQHQQQQHQQQQQALHTYAEVVSGERTDSAGTNAGNSQSSNKVPPAPPLPAYSANYNSLRQGGVGRGSKNAAPSTNTGSHPKQQQTVA